MIINSSKGAYVCIELNQDDINHILSGEELIRANNMCEGENVIVHVYCSEPLKFGNIYEPIK